MIVYIGYVVTKLHKYKSTLNVYLLLSCGKEWNINKAYMFPEQ